jgi:D-xylose transport system substrate-binding protein
MRTWPAAAAAVLMIAMSSTIMVTACGGPGSALDGPASVKQGFPIGILLPEAKTARYEAFDRPLMTQRLKELCPNCEIRYRNADQNSAAQQSQAEALVTSGVRVLILDAVDSTAAGAIVRNAKSQGVAVVAYDRLASGPVDYYVSYDNERIGQVQGEALLTALKAGGDPSEARS